MRYPEFMNSKLDIIPFIEGRNWFRIFKIISTVLFRIVIAVGALIASYFMFKVSLNNDNSSINTLSIGAAQITFFSAVLTVLCMWNSSVMEKFEDNKNILKQRYLKDTYLNEWEFLKRQHMSLGKNFSCDLTSAKYKIYYGNEHNEFELFELPVFSFDLQDAPCCKRIREIKKFCPKFEEYISREQDKYYEISDHADSDSEAPKYYFILPRIIVAMYTKILQHKIFNFLKQIIIYFLLSAIIMTIVFY